MGGRTGVIAISLMTLAFCCSVVGEIHRAKHTGKVVAQSADQASVEHQENMNTSSNSRLEVWIYSIVGTIFVGLSGIFPLLIIPFRDDTAKNLSNTPGLGLLLSFAVGGLLGDVFLHLLPEAWSHNDDSINDLTYHRYIGFWVLSGIITFLILEQTFSDNKCDNTEEIESQQDYSQKTQNTRNTESSNHVRQRQVDEKPTNKKNIKSKNGCQRNGFINPCDDHSTKTTSEVVQKQVKKEKIKV
uniref:Zinc transporter ZIP13-like n=1 Tax=Saccoglossus kowalevskii TaxID=10224 RepID=A0ABM0MLY3_SACKO|nr:PREDICTED: zinc transporter ZIP13-like [Saccoglossus kowalevskii]